jgi:hypothetical protein
MTERVVRPEEAMTMLGVRAWKFKKDFVPRLQRIQLGIRNHGFTLTSIEKLIEQLAAETPTAPKFKADTSAATKAAMDSRKAARTRQTPKRRHRTEARA